MMTRQLTLTKHQALGNDFLVALDPTGTQPISTGAWPSRCAIAARASAPTG